MPIWPLFTVWFGLVFSSIGAVYAAPQTATAGGHIRWDTCRLDNEKENSKTPVACLKPRIAAQTLLGDPKHGESQVFEMGEYYAGLHANRWLSLHSVGRRSRATLMGGVPTGRAHIIDRYDLDQAYLQIGNPAYHKVRVSTGQIQDYFGVRDSGFMEVMRYQVLREDVFWPKPALGSRLTFDSMVSSSFDLTYVSHKRATGDPETWLERTEKDQDLARYPEGVAFRSSFDISALEGFRFVFSLYGESSNNRRYGIGLINRTRRGDLSVFEWMRSTHSTALYEDYDQLFRFAFKSEYRHQQRWRFDFEYDKGQHTVCGGGIEFWLPDHGALQLGVMFLRPSSNHQPDRFMGLTGIEVSL